MNQPRQELPTLFRLLRRLERRLVREVWLFGLGRALTYGSLWLLYAFLADWGMHVPAGVRLVHLAVLVGLPLFALYRELYARLSRVPDRSGLAVLLERSHPHGELLVSAVQLAESGPQTGADPELVQRVVSDAEQSAEGLGLEGTTDPRRPRGSFGLGLASAAVCVLVLGLNARAAGVFFARIAGASTPWPQRTHLFVEIPVSGGLARAEEQEGEIRVRVARGSDVPVVVRAEGVVPDEVTLHFAGGHKAVLGSSGGAIFRTLLHSLQEDLAFHVTGGDDEDGEPRVAIEVLQPPDVSGLALAIEPPAYSGLPSRLEFDRDVEVLAGSRVAVTCLPDPPQADGLVRLLPEDRALELERCAFPAREGETETREGLCFELVADKSLRYRFELEDETGLSNPDPGLFAIHVVMDRAPEVEILSPGRAEVETVIGGALSLRARAVDDFGLESMRLVSSTPGVEEGVELVLELRAIEPAMNAQGRASAFASRRLELEELSGGSPVVEGQLFALEVSALDGRRPEGQVGSSSPVRVRVVSADEFLRRVQDRLARARLEADQLSSLIRDKRARTLELLASLESDSPELASEPVETALLLSGQRRVQGDARALARELASITSGLVYSRLDERAGLLLEELDRSTSELTDRSFHPELWAELAAGQREGRFGGAALAGKLVAIVGLALEVSEEETETAIASLRSAQEARGLEERHESLLEVAAAEDRAYAKIEQLLELLAEWDNFQSVLSLTRDILNRQKNLLERTRQYAKEN